ncbi:redox-sensing transcriptional repressor Rex [Desulfovibrio sp. X2]|uniref:redox-sensing transcriptional repressor Rex n=1 Tax=Desulfovibrio sp. X2 TaxID=941449 RepID=UPI000358B2C9|nr:redox-sensing transcriptional repressor Rex [Desulfovibrio sp. X2]EPR40842.1 redox-sensing transcriptional repressor Rex [Desulfovibrio sp. X2]
MSTLKSEHIPRATIQRLAIYVQVLESLHSDSVEVISSEHLARICDVNPSQIRKDLAYFGEFGVRGVGYYVQDLNTSIKKALGVDRTWNCALVGVGNLGRAILRHKVFKQRGFHIAGAFDCDPFKIGEVVSGLEVICSRRLPEKVKELNIEIGIITTPPERAQRAANYLVDANIKGIITFAPTRINVPENTTVEYVDFFHHFFNVAFNITLKDTEE